MGREEADLLRVGYRAQCHLLAKQAGPLRNQYPPLEKKRKIIETNTFISGT